MPGNRHVNNNVASQLDRLLRPWIKKGVKANRRVIARDISRIVLQIVERNGLQSIHGIGKRHVIEYFEELRKRGLSQRTIDRCYYRLVVFWQQLGRQNFKPPQPWGKGSYYKTSSTSADQPVDNPRNA